MWFCQLGRPYSLREICVGLACCEAFRRWGWLSGWTLREICVGLACCEGKLRHLGIPLAPRRSGPPCANEHQP